MLAVHSDGVRGRNEGKAIHYTRVLWALKLVDC